MWYDIFFLIQLTDLTQMKSVCKKYDPDKMIRREKVTSL